MASTRKAQRLAGRKRRRAAPPDPHPRARRARRFARPDHRQRRGDRLLEARHAARAASRTRTAPRRANRGGSSALEEGYTISRTRDALFDMLASFTVAPSASRRRSRERSAPRRLGPIRTSRSSATTTCHHSSRASWRWRQRWRSAAEAEEAGQSRLAFPLRSAWRRARRRPCCWLDDVYWTRACSASRSPVDATIVVSALAYLDPILARRSQNCRRTRAGRQGVGRPADQLQPAGAGDAALREGLRHGVNDPLSGLPAHRPSRFLQAKNRRRTEPWKDKVTVLPFPWPRCSPIFWDGWLHSNSTTLDSSSSKAHMLAIALFGGGLGWHPTMWNRVYHVDGCRHGIVERERDE